MGVSEARANMTEVIAEARLLDVDFVLTRRDKPQAVLMSVKRYEQAQKDSALLAGLRQYLEELADQEQKGDVPTKQRAIREALDAADRRAAENIATGSDADEKPKRRVVRVRRPKPASDD
ncbi:hypothetical protein GCM10009574_028840 [Streptomyces asiaticus]